MWDSPIYKFKTDFSGEKKTIFIDVTGSAPNFREPGKQLEGTFNVLLKGLNRSQMKILDLGGGKLRNTIYLLKKGYTVYSCEFEDLFKRSRQASNFLNKAKMFPNFKKLIFPDQFINFNKKFDVVLLINVLNIMPVAHERYFLLASCREKMKDNGRLLWYTQHGTYSESDAVTKLLDGLVTGKGRKYNMFYKDFSREEIHTILKSKGFSFNSEFKFPMSGSNKAYVFNADGDILIENALKLREISKRKKKRKLEVVERKTRWKIDGEDKQSKKIAYKTKLPTRVHRLKEIDIFEAYVKELSILSMGKKHALRYHQLIFAILISIFDNRLKKGKMEDYIAGDTQRVDITFKNHREYGFFKELSEGYKLTCPNIYIECKKYNEDPKNPEFAQMRIRLNKVRGQFGIIVCRKIKNPKKIKERQADAVKKGEYIIILEDSDIKRLVELKVSKREEEIDDYMEEKFKQLT